MLRINDILLELKCLKFISFKVTQSNAIYQAGVVDVEVEDTAVNLSQVCWQAD